MDSQWSKQYACIARATHAGCGLLSITILLVKEFDVQSVLQGHVSLAAINQICVIQEAINGCKNLKIHQMFARCKYC